MLETIVEGGVMMIPLIVCSVLALAVLIDRAWAFHQHRKIDSRALRAKILELLANDKVDEAAVLCSNTPGPVSAVLLAGLQSYLKHRQRADSVASLTTIMEKAMDDYSLHALSAVGKRLNVLSTVGNAAPLLGMTGTVLGMIAAFTGMMEEGVTGKAVAGGIAEALITTAAGLLIALFAVIPYNVFTAMADKVELEIEEAGSELLDFIATSVEHGQ
jgi:biopolymer transport protein ExbB